MKWLFLPLLCVTVLLADDTDPQEVNVNTKYTVETVHVAFVQHPKRSPGLSSSLRTDIDHVVGQKLDNQRLESLASRIKRELHVPEVSFKVAKGATPEHVAVNFEVNDRSQKIDLDVPKFTYHSRQGWSGEGKLTVNANGNAFNFGLVSDNDALVERYAGIRAGFERKNMGTDRLQLRFGFASYHTQWNGATIEAGMASEMYRVRTSFTPETTFVLVRPVEINFGFDFTRIAPDGSVLAVRRSSTESSNAVTTGMRYRGQWGNKQDVQEQALQASWGIRAATPGIKSDYSFTRQTVDAAYKYRHGRNRVDVRFLSGHISGYAPLYEMFVLGNTRTLRGWNKFDLNPAGATNAIHGSLEYSYASFLIFYDTGAAWTQAATREQKQSMGIGFRTKDGLQLAVAFPMRAGSADPVFYAGIGF